jgi:anionic cell wall polymer biosynthesis LytR-Cps2A-Psr (LCP) family protein
MIFYDKIDKDDSSLLTMVNEAGTLSSTDNHTILMILDLSDTVQTPEEDDYSEDDYTDDEYTEDEDTEDEDTTYEWENEEEEPTETYPEAYTFVIMRSTPVDKQITFMGIPNNMMTGKENQTAEDIFIDGGSAGLVSSLEYTLGIKIDRHMTFNSESFEKLCNILGGVNFAVPKGIDGMTESDSEQYLSADQIENIISYGGYSGGELQRISTVSSLVTAMVNQTSGKRISENLDSNFETIINMVESDITAIDYNDRKYAIKFMLQYSDPEDSEGRSTRAKFLTPYGKESDTKFTVDTYFTEDIKAYFDHATDENSSRVSTDDTQAESSENE